MLGLFGCQTESLIDGTGGTDANRIAKRNLVAPDVQKRLGYLHQWGGFEPQSPELPPIYVWQRNSSNIIGLSQRYLDIKLSDTTFAGFTFPV